MPSKEPQDPVATAWESGIPATPEIPAAWQRRVDSKELPSRYGEPWIDPFLEQVRPKMKEGVQILDVGSGRTPTIWPQWRPPATRYVGLDISDAELRTAGSGAYDEFVVGDIGERVEGLVGRFDLVVSWQVLEHVADLEASLENTQAYLKPGGRLVAQLSGSNAAFALLSHVLPYRIRVIAMDRLLGADPEEKFETHFDRCRKKDLDRLLATWSSHQVVPRYRGAHYFAFFRPVEVLYLAYENWIWRNEKANLATHYLVVADR